MKQYKTLKDLPGIPAGEMGKPNESGNKFRSKYFEPFYTYGFMGQYPDFFEEVKEEEKLFTLSDMRKLYTFYACNPSDMLFKKIIGELFPTIKIDQ